MASKTFADYSSEELKAIQSKGGRNKKKVVLIKDDLAKMLKLKDIDAFEPRTAQQKSIKGMIQSASQGNAKSMEMILKIMGQNPDKPVAEEVDDPFTI